MRLFLPSVSTLVAVLLTIPACGDGTTSPGDVSSQDGAAPDTDPQDVSAADGTPTDTAQPDVAADASVDSSLDTAPDDVLADAPSPDGVVDVSSGEEVDGADGDDGVTPVDAGPDAPEDTNADSTAPDTTDPGPSLGDNIFVDGSFERWSGGLPIGWVGEATNLSADGIAEDLAFPAEGLRACRLVNPSDSHKRFSSAPLAVPAGRYRCSVAVRGAGEIRFARYTGSYSSYTSYTTVADAAWRTLDYDFSLSAPTAAFELIFSIRNTDSAGGHLSVDDVVCAREVEACDALTCEDWQRCNPSTAACETAPGFCADAGECDEWQVCGDDHVCALAPGRCEGTADCGGGETPVCDLETHLCVAGDPCEGVVCEEWEVCDPADSVCDVADGRCEGPADCGDAAGEGPVCDRAAKACVAIDAAVNVVPNGGFEAWSEVSFGGTATWLLPDFWYGLEDGGTYFPETEIAAGNVRRITDGPHGGEAACQLVDTAIPADRFTTERFSVEAGATYDCAYWVRGKGTFRQRPYCAAWAPDTEFQTLDSADWQQVRFSLSTSASWCVLVFYASQTDAAAGHIQLDDVSCIRR